MKGFVDNIENRTKDNSDFRRVLYTAKHMQLVLMSLKPGEDIGEEVHQDADQFFRVEDGQGEVWIDGTRTNIKSEFAVIVPAGARHNVINTGNTPLRIYTIYAEPKHCHVIDGTIGVQAEVPSDTLPYRPRHRYASASILMRTRVMTS
jgi:mannose-6-phosphate isomerase-like protein (cupin superfamily)